MISSVFTFTLLSRRRQNQPDAVMSVYIITLCALLATLRPLLIILSNVLTLCASFAARAWARSRSTFCLGVSPGGDEDDGNDCFGEFGDVDDAEGCEAGDCFDATELGSWYGALELTYGPVAVKRVASAAERDIVLSPGLLSLWFVLFCLLAAFRFRRIY